MNILSFALRSEHIASFWNEMFLMVARSHLVRWHQQL